MVLNHGGQIKSDRAKAAAEREYAKFDALRKAERQRQADAELASLNKVVKALPKSKGGREPKP